MKNGQKKKDAFFHITKRANPSLKRGIIVRAVAILAAFLLSALVTVLLTGDNPFSVLSTLFSGAFGKGRMLNTIHELAILLCISLAVTPAFRMRFWNTGAEGQTLMGGLATAVVMLLLHDKVPTFVLILLMFLAALLVGGIWGVIPAFFKAKWKTNETLFTLMMNYIAIQAIEFFLKIADKRGSNVVDSEMLGGGIPNLFGVPYLFNIIVVALLTAALYVYLQYSKHGYEISVVGESENTARYIGINVNKVIIRTMILSGMICGLGGFLIVGGASHSIDSNIVAGRGFTAIMVSWLGKFNPIMMILTALLIVFLGRGADEITTIFGLNKSFSDILTGIILFFIIGCEFFIRYEIHWNKERIREFFHDIGNFFVTLPEKVKLLFSGKKAKAEKIADEEKQSGKEDA